MKIKTVSTVLTTNTAGQVVESRPVRTVSGPVLNTAGQLVSPVLVEETADGIPVRYVTDAVVLNSVGQPVAATPVAGGGVPLADTTPNAFVFNDVTGATLSTIYESNTVTVAGIDAASPISVTGGQYSKNGGAYTSTASTVVNGDTVKVRGTSSASNSTAVNVALTIGGVSDTYTVTTAASAGPALLALNAPIVVNGNSKNAQKFANDYTSIALALTGGRFYASPWFRQARGGDWVIDYLQRMPNCIALGKANGIDGMLWLGDATNSVGKTLPSGGAVQTPAVIEAQYRSAVTDWLTAFPSGAVTIELTAQTTSWSDGSSTDLARQDVNARIIAMCAEPGWAGRVDYIDLTTLKAALANAALSSDGTHYTTAELAKQAATIVAAKLAAKITADPLVPVTGDIAATTGFGANINTNYAYVDTDANGTPDGYLTQNLSGGTLGFSIVTRAAKRALRMAVSGSRTSASASDRIYRTIAGTTILAGDLYETIVPFEMSDLAGTGGPDEAMSPSFTSIGGSSFGTVVSAATGAFPAFTGVSRVASVPVALGSGQLSIASITGGEIIARGPIAAADTAIYLFEGWFFRKIETVAYAAPYNQAVSYTEPSDAETYAMFTGPLATKTGNVANVTAGNVSGGAIVITYQWKKDGVNIGGATTRSYDTAAVAGSYTCELTYTNSLGGLTLTSTAVVNP